MLISSWNTHNFNPLFHVNCYFHIWVCSKCRKDICYWYMPCVKYLQLLHSSYKVTVFTSVDVAVINVRSGNSLLTDTTLNVYITLKIWKFLFHFFLFVCVLWNDWTFAQCWSYLFHGGLQPFHFGLVWC